MKQIDTLFNIIMVNMCMLNDTCEDCEFADSDKDCLLSRWANRYVYEHFPERAYSIANNICISHPCEIGMCPFILNNGVCSTLVYILNYERLKGRNV